MTNADTNSARKTPSNLTALEKKYIVELWESGKKTKEIAKIVPFDIAPENITATLNQLRGRGVPVTKRYVTAREKAENKDQKKRRCLGCGASFLSSGPGNRICRRCKTSNENSGASLDDEPYSIAPFHS